jgi:LacI family transcriptional regulator
MRPTTKDLAKEAGVSLATVDRVLNDRPGVKLKTVTLVNEAIEKIGFVRNIQAANLARSKHYKFQFILPLSGGAFRNELIKRIQEVNLSLIADAILVEAVHIDVNDPHTVANHLASLKSDIIDGVAIMAPEAPQVRDAIARLTERSIEVVQFLSGQPKVSELDFVGIDNHAAGATAASLVGRFLTPSKGKIMIISDSMQSRDALERRLGFDEVIRTEYPNLDVLPSLETYGSEKRTKHIIQQCVENNPDLCAAYVMSSEAERSIVELDKSIGTDRLVLVAHERTAFTEQALLNDQIDAIIAQNTGHAVRSAIRIMKARCEQREPFTSQETIRIEILLKQNL